MSGCALYGKIESEADFVRVGAGLPGEMALQRWLKDGIERSGGVVPEVAVRFVRRVEPDGELWAGVWVPSRDAVGREFPLAVFAPLTEDVTQLPLACIPSGLTRFTEEAEQSLAGLVGSHLEVAREVCARLVPIHASELPHAWGRCVERAESRSVRDFAAGVFGPDAVEQWYYALRALRSAAQAGAGRMPSLSFPIVDAEDAFVWLELLEDACAGARPDVYWTAGARPRLLAAFSDAVRVFGSVWAEEGADQGIWPVTTSRPAAIEEAQATLSPAELTMLDDGRGLVTCLPSLRRHA